MLHLFGGQSHIAKYMCLINNCLEEINNLKNKAAECLQSSLKTDLHPIHVLFFLVNMASLLTFDVTMVFVSVCCPSEKIES